MIALAILGAGVWAGWLLRGCRQAPPAPVEPAPRPRPQVFVEPPDPAIGQDAGWTYPHARTVRGVWNREADLYLCGSCEATISHVPAVHGLPPSLPAATRCPSCRAHVVRP